VTYYPAFGIEITGSPDHVILHKMLNPLTRSQVKLVPPIEINSAGDFAGFGEWFSSWCLREWGITDHRGVHNDPAQVDASGWREDQSRCV
jgi:hypothetical protein